MLHFLVAQTRDGFNIDDIAVGKTMDEVKILPLNAYIYIYMGVVFAVWSVIEFLEFYRSCF